MSTSCNVLEGWSDANELADLLGGENAIVNATTIQTEDVLYPIPVTIIPGHWARRIQSGQLLDPEDFVIAEENFKRAHKLWKDGGLGDREPTLIHFALQRLADKFRGEDNSKEPEDDTWDFNFEGDSELDIDPDFGDK